MGHSAYRRPMHEPPQPAPALSSRVAGWVAWAALAAGFVWLGTGVFNRMTGPGTPDRQFRDFYEFYSASAAMLRGQDIYSAGELGYIYPPLLAFLMLPLALLPLTAAGLVWLGLKLAALALALRWCAAECVRCLAIAPDRSLLPVAAAVGAAVLVDKLRPEMNMQQTNLLMLLSWVLGLRWLDRRPLLAGIALGFGANIKYLTLLSVPYLLARGRFRAACATLVSSAAWALLPAAWLGWNQNLRYLAGAFTGLAQMSTPGETASGIARVQKLETLGVSLPRCMTVLTGQSPTSPAVLCLLAATGALFFGALWLVYHLHGQAMFISPWANPEPSRRPGAVALLEWVGLIAFALAFGPQTNSPHLSQLLLMTVLGATLLLAPPGASDSLDPNVARSRAWVLGAMGILFLGITLPPSSDSARAAVGTWHRLAGPSWCLLTSTVLLARGLFVWCEARATRPHWHARSHPANAHAGSPADARPHTTDMPATHR